MFLARPEGRAAAVLGAMTGALSRFTSAALSVSTGRHGGGRVLQGLGPRGLLHAEDHRELRPFLRYLVNGLLRQLHHHPGDADRAGLELAGPDLLYENAVDRYLLQRLKPGIFDLQHKLIPPQGEGFILDRLVGGNVNAVRGNPDGFHYGVLGGVDQRGILRQQYGRYR